jgi:hypothetical protein
LVTGDREGFLTLFLESGAGLTNAGHIQANSSAIDVNYNSFPFVVDWNEDGKKDLIVGEQSPVEGNFGNIRIYLNEGTNANPAFGNYSILYAGSNQLYMFRVTPVVYDLDTDGLKDVMAGNDDWRVYFFKNIGTNAAPAFDSTYDTLRTENGVPIDVDNGSRIHFVDWTGDGDLDLLIGGYAGYVQYYENTTLTAIAENEQQLITIQGPDITPNPFKGNAQFSYSLETSAHVRLEIFSVDGRLVRALVDQMQAIGQHQFVWAATDARGRQLPAGIYLVRITDGFQTNTKSIVLTR